MFRNRSFALALLALTACGGKEDAASSTDTASGAAATAIVLGAQDVATAEMRPVGSSITLSGSLEPADVVAITAQVPGTVTNVRVNRGTAVARGTVLATIEAQGIRGAAAGTRAQVAAAQAQLSLAQQRLAAARRLNEAGAISDIDYKAAQANVDLAQAQLEGARAQAAGAAESAARATIASPINGVVAARAVNGGEAVGVGDPLFTIVNSAELELAGQIGVQDAGRVRVGQPVAFTIEAYPNQVFRGRVERIDPRADPGTRQVGVYIRLPNPGMRIVGGQFARGSIVQGGTTTRLMVPESALINRNGDSADAFRIAGNRVQKVSLRIASDAAPGMVAVMSGLSAGDRVLLNPTVDLRDGASVSVAADRPTAR